MGYNRLLILLDEVEPSGVQCGETWHAIAQTNPDSSRAIAVVTVVAGFPAFASFLYRLHSRTCAFQAVSRIVFGSCSWRINCSL
jgi:hypothetical protein